MSAALPFPASEGGPESEEEILPTPVQAVSLLGPYTPLDNPAALIRLVQGVGAFSSSCRNSGTIIEWRRQRLVKIQGRSTGHRGGAGGILGVRQQEFTHQGAVPRQRPASCCWPGSKRGRGHFSPWTFVVDLTVFGPSR